MNIALSFEKVCIEYGVKCNNDVREYLESNVSILDIIALYEVLFPSTQIVDQHIILDIPGLHREEDLRELELKLKLLDSAKERKSLVENYNWVEAGYFFANNEVQIIKDQKFVDFSNFADEWMARLMVSTWKMHLEKTYSSRKFRVFVIPPEKTGSVMGAGFEEI